MIIPITELKQDLKITPVKFLQLKQQYNIECTYQIFKQYWEQIDDNILKIEDPQIMYQHKSFNETYFGIPVKNPTQSDSARYFYLHIGDLRILQTTHPFKPGKYPILAYQIDEIITKMIHNIIKDDVIKKLIEQKTNIVLQKIL